jgi:hypothetical protein
MKSVTERLVPPLFPYEWLTPHCAPLSASQRFRQKISDFKSSAKKTCAPFLRKGRWVNTMNKLMDYPSSGAAFASAVLDGNLACAIAPFYGLAATTLFLFADQGTEPPKGAYFPARWFYAVTHINKCTMHASAYMGLPMGFLMWVNNAAIAIQRGRPEKLGQVACDVWGAVSSIYDYDKKSKIWAKKVAEAKATGGPMPTKEDLQDSNRNLVQKMMFSRHTGFVLGWVGIGMKAVESYRLFEEPPTRMDGAVMALVVALSAYQTVFGKIWGEMKYAESEGREYPWKAAAQRVSERTKKVRNKISTCLEAARPLGRGSLAPALAAPQF